MAEIDTSWLSTPVQHEPFDLTTGIASMTSGLEIYRKKISGHARSLQKYTFCNVIECVLEEVRLENADLSETDLKDCVFRNTVFDRCRLDVLSMATDTFLECEFVECTFSNSTLQNCLFRHVRFRHCDFSRLLIKECRFEGCAFEDCVTSNKLFEMCFLVDCRLRGTDIQVDTVLSNLGLKVTDLEDSRIRSGRSDTPFEYVPTSDLREAAERLRDRAPALVEFRLDYFENGSLLQASPGLDRAFDIETWKEVSRNPASFLEVYLGFSDFLIFLYENDHLFLHHLLRLHDLSGEFQSLAKRLPFEMATSIMGVHQQLSIYVEEVFLLSEELAAERGTKLDLLVQGPTNELEVKEILYPLFLPPESASISHLRPRNSPWDLSVNFLSLNHCMRALLLLLATRVKSKIVQMKPGPLKGRSNQENPPKSLVEIGPIRDSSVTFGYGVTVLLPKKRLLELQLAFDTRTLSRMAAFLIALG